MYVRTHVYVEAGDNSIISWMSQLESDSSD